MVGYSEKSSTKCQFFRLQVTDSWTRRNFLVDNDDESISPIRVVGETRLKLDLGLKQNFYWSFIIAGVNTPIIVSDFIKHHDLQIDLRRNRLIDNITGNDSQLQLPSTSTIVCLKTLRTNNPFADLLEGFQHITLRFQNEINHFYAN